MENEQCYLSLKKVVTAVRGQVQAYVVSICRHLQSQLSPVGSLGVVPQLSVTLPVKQQRRQTHGAAVPSHS